MFPDLTEWAVGYLLGLAAIALFSNERLNSLPGDAAIAGRERLIRLLLPGQMARRGVYRRGVVIYFLALAAIYTVFAWFGSYFLPLLGKSLAGDLALSADDPIWPLAIALALVGLVPQIGVLSRVEQKARGAAHWLIGVPENFNDFTDRLMRVEMTADDLPSDLLDPQETEKLLALLQRAETALGTGNDYRTLEQNAIKLWCFREWAGKPADWPSAEVRGDFSKIERDIRPATLAVIEDLETLPGAPDSMAGADTFHSRWKSVAERANSATDDVCALFALFAARADSRPEKQNPISETLRTLIDRANADRRTKAAMSDHLLLVCLGMIVVTFGAGYFGLVQNQLGGNEETLSSGREKFAVSFDYLVRMALMFAPATILAVVARRRQNPAWLNLFAGPDAPDGTAHVPTRQYLGLALRAGLAVLVLVVGYTFYQQLAAHMERHPDNGHFACVAWQHLGLELARFRAQCLPLIDGVGIDSPNYIPGMWYSVHYAVIGACAAVSLALVADCLSGPARHLRLAGVIALAQAALAVTITYVAAGFLDLTQHLPALVRFEAFSIGLLNLLLLLAGAWAVPPRPAGVPVAPAPDPAPA